MSDVSEPTPRSDDGTTPAEEAGVGGEEHTEHQQSANDAGAPDAGSTEATNGATGEGGESEVGETPDQKERTGRDSGSEDPAAAWTPRERDFIPLLPRGTTLFDGMPAEAIVLEALCPAIGNGAIIVRRPDAVGVVLVQDGALFEKYAFQGDTKLIGDRALAEVKGWSDAAISAYRFDPLIVAVAPSLLRGDPLYSDLRLTWADWDELLADLCSRDGSYVVELDTPLGRGVTCILDGRQVATYTSDHPEFGEESLLTPLAATGRGTIWVRREPRIADEAAAERAASEMVVHGDAEAADAGLWQEPAGQVEAGQSPVGDTPARPQQADAGEPPWALAPIGEALAAAEPMADAPAWPPPAPGGRAEGSEQEAAPVGPNPPWANAFPAGPGESPAPQPPATTPFGDFFQTPAPTEESQSPLAKLAPDLKLIARSRLQRSSPRVESIIDEAVHESGSLDTVLAEIRGLVIRGVMQSTLDEVVDEMATRARRPLA